MLCNKTYNKTDFSSDIVMIHKEMQGGNYSSKMLIHCVKC